MKHIYDIKCDLASTILHVASRGLSKFLEKSSLPSL